MRRTVSRFLAALSGLFAGPALACDLALALAVDVSGSVDQHEYSIQMGGLATALRDPVIAETLVRGRAQLKLVQWTGSSRQQISIPWTVMEGFTDLEQFADRVAADARLWRSYSTAIGEAVLFTMRDFDKVEHCARKLIDVSGDGPNNEGIEPEEIRRELKRRGIVVNAIAIEASEPDLTDYFFEHVIHGEGAFVVTADSFSDYPGKIRKKLLREVTQQTSSLLPGVITRSPSVITSTDENAAPRQKTALIALTAP